MTTNIIFPAYPDAPKQLNPYFKPEVEAAEKAGFGVSIISDDNTSGPVRMTQREADSYIYRGWLVKPAYYQEMSDMIGGKLLNSYQNYMSSYELPCWYPHFTVEETPESFYIEAHEIVKVGLQGVAHQVINYFESDAPLMMKDYLKSCKYEWYDACLIKEGSDANEIIRVTTNFLELRGKDFVGGLVYRKLLNLKRAGIHPKTRTPVPIEYRTFFLNQKPMMTFSIWEMLGIDYGMEGSPPPQDFLQAVGQKIISPFVAVDLAKDQDDKWWVIEVNDGGAAGLPEHINFQEFYNKLHQGIHEQH